MVTKRKTTRKRVTGFDRYLLSIYGAAATEVPPATKRRLRRQYREQKKYLHVEH